MIVKLLTEHLLECLGLKGGCRGSSESTHVKMPHGWKSHALAHFILDCLQFKKTSRSNFFFYCYITAVKADNFLPKVIFILFVSKA